MRVLHLTTEFPPVIYGGLGTAIGGLVWASAAEGISVGVVLLGESGSGGYERATGTGTSGARARSLSPRGGVRLFRVPSSHDVDTCLRIVRAWRPDVVHLHVHWLWHVADAIQQQTGLPLVYTVHSLDRAEYEIGQGPPECVPQSETQAAVIAAADRIIALSHSEAVFIAQFYPMVAERISIVGNGIEDTVAAQQAVNRPSSDPPLVLFTGRFVQRKGIRDLLDAIPTVLARAPRTRFVLAGGHRHSSAREVESWWLSDELTAFRNQIHFTGWLDPSEMSEWYCASDILVVPSWYEPFGMVILEGMLHGLAIAAARVGGPAEILKHGRTGLLFPPRDANALAASLLELIENRDLRNRLRSAAAADVRRKWLWPIILRKMERVYRLAMTCTSKS